MIQSIITDRCPHCGSENLVKNGHDYKGAQKYACKACGRYGTVQAQRGYGEAMRRQVQRAVLERVSWRGLERLLGISRRTVAHWVEAWASHPWKRRWRRLIWMMSWNWMRCGPLCSQKRGATLDLGAYGSNINLQGGIRTGGQFSQYRGFWTDLPISICLSMSLSARLSKLSSAKSTIDS
jgi:transposase-like protein